METVLVVGASGKIGVSVIIAALRTKKNVLAVVRNQASADKIFQHVGTKDGITTVVADITTEDSIQKVVDRVKAGELPPFQHVYAAGMLAYHCYPLPGLTYPYAVGVLNATSLVDVDTALFREVINITLESTFCKTLIRRSKMKEP